MMYRRATTAWPSHDRKGAVRLPVNLRFLTVAALLMVAAPLMIAALLKATDPI